jgi:hypothetical protein
MQEDTDECKRDARVDGAQRRARALGQRRERHALEHCCKIEHYSARV